tara:strand:+ start:824 stop:1567 length:744 start_codon:yes stop_codon:yes gene_type:complete
MELNTYEKQNVATVLFLFFVILVVVSIKTNFFGMYPKPLHEYMIGKIKRGLKKSKKAKSIGNNMSDMSKKFKRFADKKFKVVRQSAKQNARNITQQKNRLRRNAKQLNRLRNRLQNFRKNIRMDLNNSIMTNETERKKIAGDVQKLTDEVERRREKLSSRIRKLRDTVNKNASETLLFKDNIEDNIKSQINNLANNINEELKNIKTELDTLRAVIEAKMDANPLNAAPGEGTAYPTEEDDDNIDTMS